MKNPWFTLCLCLASANLLPAAGTESLDSLLQQVRAGHSEAATERSEREARFLNARDGQETLLQDARDELIAAKKRGDALKASYVDNERRLAELDVQLKEEMGEMGEVFGTVRQVARETAGLLESSPVSAQLPGRADTMQAIASQASLPNTQQLKSLWETMLEETIRAGSVERFKTPVIDPQGNESSAEVVRIGLFGLISDGKFYKYNSEFQKVVALPAQPKAYLRKTVEDFEATRSGFGVVALDPTAAAGGSLLELEAIRPSMTERLQGGGIVGYVIIGIGVIALLIGLERFIVLSLTARQVRQQINSPGEPGDNCIGRIIQTYHAYDSGEDRTETLEHKMDEAILKEIPRLERFLPLLKILAAIAPLLGLLGTVTGMIATFQAITLFGTGDPKLMAGGISQALVTTMLGLIVAIPILLLHNMLAGMSNRLTGQIEEQSVGLIAEYSAKKNSKVQA